MRRLLGPAALALTALAPSAAASAEPESEDEIVDETVLGPRGILRTRADEVSFDARAKSLELSGDVRVDGPPFHLRADRIRLTRTRYGIEVDGKGRLAFCPCLGTPITVGFRGAIVAPPGDLILEQPTLRVYGVPVFALPYFWLRSQDRMGLLPPDLAYRGQDGFFAGGGAHLPWKTRGERSAVDLRAGGYVKGGFALDARLLTPGSQTRVRFDRLPGARAPLLPGDGGQDPDQGLRVDARGSTRGAGAQVAWDVDVLRGRRGVVSTSELDVAAKPWDRASAEASVRGDAIVASMGALGTSRRGGALGKVEVAGPLARLRTSGAAWRHLTWDASAEGGALRSSAREVAFLAAEPVGTAPDGEGTMAFARGELGMRASGSASIVRATLTTRGAGSVARDASREGDELAASARFRASVPLERTFGGGGEALSHLVDPFVEAALLHADDVGLLSSPMVRGAVVASGTAPVADAGLATSLGHWARRDALSARASVGGARDPSSSEIVPLGRGRVAVSSTWAAAMVDAATTLGTMPTRGVAAAARTRLGRETDLRLTGHVEVREGMDPVLARALDDAALAPAAGFFRREGVTTGGGLVVPWSRFVTTSAHADVDASSAELVAARGAVELRDRCGCVTLRAIGSHRLGRDGVDVWLMLDVAPR